MSGSESAADRGNDDVLEDDCPLCLEPLPPFWDTKRRVINICCGKETCKDCYDKKVGFLDRAISEGSIGKEEKQLAGFCPMCRAKLPEGGCYAMIMQGKFEDGRLPLHMYRDWGRVGNEGVKVDVERGMEILMLGAEKGDPNCQYIIGNCYRRGGFGLPKSVEDAKRWLSVATEQGHAEAEYELAFMLKDEGKRMLNS